MVQVKDAVRVVGFIAMFGAAAAGAAASELAVLGGWTNPNPDDRVAHVGRRSTPGASIGFRYFPSSGNRVSFALDYSGMFFGGPFRRKPLAFNFQGGMAHHCAMGVRFTNKENLGPYALIGFGPAFFTGSLFVPGALAAAGYTFAVSDDYRIGAEAAARFFMQVRHRDGGRHLTTINPSVYLSRKF